MMKEKCLLESQIPCLEMFSNRLVFSKFQGDLPRRALQCFAFDDPDPIFQRLNPKVEFQNSDSGGVHCVQAESGNHGNEDKSVYLAELLEYSR